MQVNRSLTNSGRTSSRVARNPKYVGLCVFSNTCRTTGDRTRQRWRGRVPHKRKVNSFRCELNPRSSDSFGIGRRVRGYEQGVAPVRYEL